MNVSRRSFLSGATVLGAGAVLGGLAGCSPQAELKEPAEQGGEKTAAHNPVRTESFDVVVVGSGTAGTCAALRAAELGASVLCVEKNSGLCGTSAFAEGLCAASTRAFSWSRASPSTSSRWSRTRWITTTTHAAARW